MGELVSIVYKPEGATPTDERYTRVPLQEAQLVVGKGIDGDVKGATESRQLNIMAAGALHSLAGEGFAVTPGSMGEQLTVAGVDIDNLQPGARLQIGATACIEVTEPRTGCGKFERYQGKLKEEASGRLGMMARVVVGGVIRVGDAVAAVL